MKLYNNDALYKKCSKCKIWKGLKEYYKHKRAKDGCLYSCKVCTNKTSKISKEKRKLKTNGLCCIWDGIKDRCFNKNTVHYHRYGGRGIAICSEWLNHFDIFYKWAIDNGHKKGLEIDRINNDGNYEPSNCRFVTPAVNIQNSSSAKLNKKSIREIRKMTRDGIMNKDIAKMYNVDRSTISNIKTRKTWKNIP